MGSGQGWSDGENFVNLTSCTSAAVWEDLKRDKPQERKTSPAKVNVVRTMSFHPETFM